MIFSSEGAAAETNHIHAYCPVLKTRTQVPYQGGPIPACPECGACELEDLSIHPPHAVLRRIEFDPASLPDEVDFASREQFVAYYIGEAYS